MNGDGQTFSAQATVRIEYRDGVLTPDDVRERVERLIGYFHAQGMTSFLHDGRELKVSMADFRFVRLMVMGLFDSLQFDERPNPTPPTLPTTKLRKKRLPRRSPTVFGGRQRFQWN